MDDVGDPDLLADIAKNMTYFLHCDSNWIAEKLILNEDPGIRFELAKNDETPKHILARLKQDPDSSIREEAEEALEFWMGEDDDEEADIVIEDE